MAPNNLSESPIEVQKDWQPTGHDICYIFALHNLDALQHDWNFIQDFCTDCEVSDTSWKFKMALHRNPNNGAVSGYATLERNDTLNGLVGADFLIEFQHGEWHRHVYPSDLWDVLILPGGGKHIHISTIVPDHLKHLMQEEIKFVIYIFVGNCHIGQSKKVLATPGSEPGGKQLQCLKL